MPPSYFHSVVAPVASSTRRIARPGNSTALARSRCSSSFRADPVAVEILRVGPRAHAGARLPRWCRARPAQLLDGKAVLEGDRPSRAVALHAHFQPLRKRVGDRNADPVQPAGEGIGGAARLLVEFPARVQPREDHLDGGNLFLRVRADRNAAAVVLHAHRAVGVQRHGDRLRGTRERLVGGVVHDLLDDVQRRVGPGVHPRALLHGLEALQDADASFVVARGGHADRQSYNIRIIYDYSAAGKAAGRPVSAR